MMPHQSMACSCSVPVSARAFWAATGCGTAASGRCLRSEICQISDFTVNCALNGKQAARVPRMIKFWEPKMNP